MQKLLRGLPAIVGISKLLKIQKILVLEHYSHHEKNIKITYQI